MCVCGVQESQSEVDRLQKQKEELCAQIRDLSLPVDLTRESLPDLKKQLRMLESQASERAEDVTKLTAQIQQQQQVYTHGHAWLPNSAPRFSPCFSRSLPDTHALRDGDGEDETDPSEGVGG